MTAERAPRLSDDLLESMLYHRERTDDTNAYRVAAEVQDVRALRPRIERMATFKANQNGNAICPMCRCLDSRAGCHPSCGGPLLRELLSVLGGGDGERR